MAAAPDEAAGAGRVRVRLFGVQAQRAGRDAVPVEIDAGRTTLARLRERLAAAEPSLAASLPSSRFAVDHAYADEDAVLTGGEEVALIGLVGGG